MNQSLNTESKFPRPTKREFIEQPTKFAPQPDDPIVEHALHYALDVSNRWFVFPVPIGTKKSHKSKEHSDGRKWGATRDCDEIKRDFKHWPDANVGVVTGEVSGIFVVEADTREGHDVDGIASLKALQAEHGALPPTRQAMSPSGSVHYYFKHPGYKIKNSASEIAPGVDVRGDGGMVVVPPSVKPGKGAYRWLNDLPIADPPQWLLDRIAAGKAESDQEPQLSISGRALATISSRPDPFLDHARSSRHGAGNGTGYIEAALQGEYDEVARSPKSGRNHQLNVSAVKLGHYVGSGLLDEKKVIDTLMDACRANGLLSDDGKQQCSATIKSGMEKGKTEPKGIPERAPDSAPERTPDQEQSPHTNAPQTEPKRIVIRATSFVLKDPTTLPRRQWLYGKLLLRKFVSATISPGSVGKSSLIAAEALAMVSGMPLLDITPPEPLRVWLWNLEDPQEETERKLGAAALHYGLDPNDIGDRLKVDSGREAPLVIAYTERNSTKIAHPVVDALVEEIVRLKIDVLIVDPFVSCHEVSENDNGGMDKVIKEWGRVADRGNCAVHLVHHTRKMTGGENEVTVDSGRGASSQTDGLRAVRTLNRMTKEQAAEVEIENPWLYFRTMNGKPNLEPPADKSDWYRLVSVDLGNEDSQGPSDSLGVVTTWEYPTALSGITADDFQKVAKVIRSGKWRESPQSKDWVGKAVAEALDLDTENKAHKAKIKRALAAWRKAGSLVVVQGLDENRNRRTFVEVAEG